VIVNDNLTGCWLYLRGCVHDLPFDTFKNLNVKNVVLPIIRLTALAADWHTRKFFRD
jgi:hypothetical protein